MGHIPALVLEKWSLRVDPESAYSSFDADPEPGDAFMTKSAAGNRFGFKGRLDQASAYVTLEGDAIAEPNWGADRYIGFKRWAVGYEDAGRWINLVPLQDLQA